MRLVTMQLSKSVSRLLAQISKEYALVDTGLAEDLFILLIHRGSGIPSPARTELLAQAAATEPRQAMVMRMLFVSRRRLLERICFTAIFQTLAASKPTTESVGTLFRAFRRLHHRVMKTVCDHCELSASCRFYARYSRMGETPSNVLVESELELVHPKCPDVPPKGFMQLLDQALTTWQELTAPSGVAATASVSVLSDDDDGKPLAMSLAEIEAQARVTQSSAIVDEHDDNLSQEQVASYSGNARFNYGCMKGVNGCGYFTGSHHCVPPMDLVNSLSEQSLALYRLGVELSTMLGQSESPKFNPVSHRTPDHEQALVRSVADTPHLVPSQHGLPAEIYSAKAGANQLVRREHQDCEERKRLLYLVIDSSGSMASLITHKKGNPFCLLTRGSMATVFACALLKKLGKERGLGYVRFFAGTPSPLLVADKPASVDTTIEHVRANSYSGGSTNIMLALKAAVTDIRRAEGSSPLAGARLLLITDGDDFAVTEKGIKDMFDVPKHPSRSERNVAIQLAVLDVSGQFLTPQRVAAPYVKALRDQAGQDYHFVDPAASKLGDLVKLASVTATP